MVEFEYTPCTCHDQEHRIVFDTKTMVAMLLQQVDDDELEWIKTTVGDEVFRRWALQSQQRLHVCLVCGFVVPEDQLLLVYGEWKCRDTAICLGRIAGRKNRRMTRGRDGTN